MSEMSTGLPKEKGAPAKSALRHPELRTAYCPCQVIARRAFKRDQLPSALGEKGCNIVSESRRTTNQRHFRVFFSHVLAMRLVKKGSQ
jgi:hypothetical protein